jgi:dTDP-4-amino-4,6-dideoxygalactose transaminase
MAARVPPPRVPIVRPDLGAAEADAAARVVRSGWVMQGPEVAAFEAELAAAVGAPHAVAVSSGTAALELALRVLGVGPGDEVVTVSHSFIATANAVVTVGARPVFVDVEPDTLGMDPVRLRAALGPRTKAVLCVHQLGIPCDLPRVLAVAAEHGVPVVEDAACAVGSELRVGDVWQRIGRPHGRIACFSFHPRKVITTGDGGMITTGSATLAARMRLLRNHAMTVPPEARERDPLAHETFAEPAYNLRMTDVQAAIGRPQLARLDAIVAERRRLASVYDAVLAEHPVLAAPVARADARPNWQSYPVQIRDGARATRDELLRHFVDRGIACRRGVANAHEEPAYSGRANWAGGPLPVSERLRTHTLVLPLFHGMTAEEQGLVVAAIDELRRA